MIAADGNPHEPSETGRDASGNAAEEEAEALDPPLEALRERTAQLAEVERITAVTPNGKDLPKEPGRIAGTAHDSPP